MILETVVKSSTYKDGYKNRRKIYFIFYDTSIYDDSKPS